MNERADFAELSEYLDGTLDERGVHRVQELLDGSAEHRHVLEQLRQVKARARALGEVDPPSDLWPAIQGALESEQQDETAVLPLRPTAMGGDARGRRLIRLTVTQAIAASVALVALSAGAVWSLARPNPSGGIAVVESAPGSIVPAASEMPAGVAGELEALEAALLGYRNALSPATLAIVDKNIGIIERAIAESIDALRLDPGNEYVQTHLDRSYRTKVEYLREAIAIAQRSS